VDDGGEKLASFIGFSIYASVAMCILLTLAAFSCKQGESASLEGLSVRCGLLFFKACILLGGKCGPLVYTGFILQIFSFARMLGQRREDWPGQGFPIYVMFAFLTTTLSFLRTGHRERMNSLKYEWACPGNTACAPSTQHFLMICDATFPYILGLLMLPVIAKIEIYTVALRQKDCLSPRESESMDGLELGKIDYEEVTQTYKDTEAGISEAKIEEEKQVRSPFVGSMRSGMSFYLMPVLLSVVVNSSFVYKSQEELIFTDRVAPKFLFDAVRALITIFF